LDLIYRGASGADVTIGDAGSDDTAYVLTSAEGLYDLRADVYAVDAADGIGSVYVSSCVRGKRIVLSGVITKDVYAMRRRLAACMTPLQPGWLTLRRQEGESLMERRIRCVPEAGPVFDKANATWFTAALIAPSPWWEDVGNETVTSLSGWEGHVVFPWSVMPGSIFGGRTLDTTVNINNPGDVPTGLIIRMYAAGPVIKPSVIRPDTSETLTINTAMAAGEAFEINTGVGEKYVKLIRAGGAVERGVRYLAHDSVFHQLAPGDNLFRADAQSGEEALTVTMSYHPKYISV
jgi:hypothetical protein